MQKYKITDIYEGDAWYPIKDKLIGKIINPIDELESYELGTYGFCCVIDDRFYDFYAVKLEGMGEMVYNEAQLIEEAKKEWDNAM